jgi:hypothetical protein
MAWGAVQLLGDVSGISDLRRGRRGHGDGGRRCPRHGDAGLSEEIAFSRRQWLLQTYTCPSPQAADQMRDGVAADDVGETREQASGSGDSHGKLQR